MRTFLRAHWKALVAIVLLVLLALFTLSPSAAISGPSLALRLRAHAGAIASGEHNTRYIENVLQGEGYAIRRQENQADGQKIRNIEVSVSNVAPGTRPARIFIVGAHYDAASGAQGASDNGSGTAAVLELARLLKDMRPSQGTEVRFVFFVNQEPPWLGGDMRGEEMGSMQHARGALAPETIGWYSQQRRSRTLPPGMEGRFPDTGNFIAFVGTLESSRLVQDALSAFRAVSDLPSHGLAVPDYVQGVTLSGHSSYKHFGYPAIMITDTAFMRYPYYKMKADDGALDPPDKLDYDSTARVVQGLARTITALAAGAQG
jgi:hypothetical protein